MMANKLIQVKASGMMCSIVETAVPVSGREFVNLPLGRRRRAGK
jgi:hypothetical protein